MLGILAGGRGRSQVVTERIVVVGAGLAGLRTSEELRSAGYTGALTLIGAETRPPYDRPPLSKQLMMGTVDDTTLREELDSLGAVIRLGERAEELTEDLVRTDQGDYGYDRLVIATGSRPIGLPGSGRQRFLRTAEDALALRGALVPGVSLVIIGAGWIGAELATAAAAKSCQVTVVEAGAAPLAAAIGADVGVLTAPWYEHAGVELLLGTAVQSVQEDGLRLADGTWLPADLVVTAVGVRPDVGWLESSGIELDNGVAVDAELRSSMAGVYAVGDCAAYWSGRFGRRLRTEHWDGALRAPIVLAANLIGGSESYDPVPYFWSEQFGRMVQYVGHHAGAERLVFRGDPAERKWGACWLSGERMLAVLTVDVPKDLVQGRRLIEAGHPVDPAKLADPSVPLRDAVVA